MPHPSVQRQFLRVGTAQWAYTEGGSGDELWVTFHGYGHDAEVMQRFMGHFRPGVRAVHIDLPHHGETVLGHESLSPSDLEALLSHLLREKGAARCSLLAFSLGGKVALKLAEMMPGRVQRMVLIAPDGLKVNPLYNFTANTRLGGWLYGRVTHDPANLFAAARMLRRSRMLHPKVETFMHHQLDTREKRERVYGVWRAFRHITPDRRDIISKIHRYGIETVLVLGKYDRIIRPALGRKLDSGRDPNIRTVLLDRGHDLVTDEVAVELRGLLR